jgi:acylphosphatase
VTGEPAASKAVRVVVRGLVQGVYFRAATREAAVGMGLTGWVRNRGDGGVEALIQGPAAAVDAMVEWCRSGPPHARVDKLERSEIAYDPGLTRFGIRP